MMKISRHPFCGFISGLMILSLGACSKENYLYVKKQAAKTDQSFRVKEVKGSNAVDIIWVIDNSGSMDTYQRQVINNASAFMQDFIKQHLNWKMGLLSTDENDRPYAGFAGSMQLDSTIPNPVNVFANAVDRLGTNGSGNEKTFSPILNSLTIDSNFLRPGVPLAVIMVTDAYEQSSITAPVFNSRFATLTQGRSIFAYGVYASKDFGCQSDEGIWYYKDSPYEAFIKIATIGQTFPLCKDFGASLANIAHDIVTRIAHTAIYLNGRPDTSTLKVLYQNQELPAGPVEKGGYWVYDYRLNAVVFNNLDFAKNDTDSVRIIFDEEEN